jgi:CRP-like cAMP-binding protein
VPADGGDRLESRVERVLALRAFPGLSDVDANDLAVLTEITHERIYPKGAVLSPPGEPARAMHLIRQGRVAILRDGVPTRRYASGDIVGAIAVLSRSPSGQHVVAELETRTFEIERRDLEDVLEESVSVLLAALRGTMRTVLQARQALPGDAGFDAPISEISREPIGRGLVERVLFARRLLTYGRARVEALAELTREMTEVSAPAGTVLWEPGMPATYSLLVWSGRVLCETPEGQRFRFGPDSVLGGIDSLAAADRWYRASAETDVFALRGDVAHLLDALEDHPDMGIDMLRSGARILLDLHERLDRLSLPPR